MHGECNACRPLTDLWRHGPTCFDTLWSLLDVEQSQTRCGLSLCVNVQMLVQTAFMTQCAIKRDSTMAHWFQNKVRKLRYNHPVIILNLQSV